MVNYFDFHSRSPTIHYLASTAKIRFTSNLHDFLEDQGMPFASAILTAHTLLERMSSPAIHYHSPIHVLFILDFAQEHEIELLWPEELAIWFHDSIYDVNQKTGVNEKYSAMFMEAQVGPYLDPRGVLDAGAMIRATGDHFSKEMPKHLQKVVDLDVSHFSLPREQYKITTDLLRLEYSSISDEAFDAGRKDFLTHFLAKGFIYRSEPFQQFEEAARNNIEQDLKELS